MIQRSFYILLLLVIAVHARGQITYEERLEQLYKHTVPLITDTKLNEEIGQNKNMVILDTRSIREYNASHLKDAKFIDYDTFNKKMVKEIDKEATVIVYCSVGYRSERIGEKLQKMGYKNVYNLYGGIFQWVNEDNPIINQQGVKTDTVHTYNKTWSKWLKKGVKVYE
ncbi:MAG: rhodanese-like domain-containing protein [Bacteroidota bacterium]